MQLLGKRYTSSRQWSNVWPSILEVHPIPCPTVGRGAGLHQSVGYVVPRDTLNATAQNASKIDLVHLQVGPFSHLRNVQEKRQCRVRDRSLTDLPTHSHLLFSQNRCCGHWQRWPYANGIVNGTLVWFLVDAEANITIIQTQLWEAMSPSPASTPSQLKIVLDTMKLADGRSSSFQGRAKMTIGLGNRKLVHSICLEEIEPEGILGLDFLDNVTAN